MKRNTNNLSIFPRGEILSTRRNTCLITVPVIPQCTSYAHGSVKGYCRCLSEINLFNETWPRVYAKMTHALSQVLNLSVLFIYRTKGNCNVRTNLNKLLCFWPRLKMCHQCILCGEVHYWHREWALDSKSFRIPCYWWATCCSPVTGNTG